jgi:hypothetical protein
VSAYVPPAPKRRGLSLIGLLAFASIPAVFIVLMCVGEMMEGALP